MIDRGPYLIRQHSPGVWTASAREPLPPVVLTVTGWQDLTEPRVDLANSTFEPSMAAFVIDFGPQPPQ